MTMVPSSALATAAPSSWKKPTMLSINPPCYGVSPRLLWDPGILTMLSASTTTIVTTRARRVWDPGMSNGSICSSISPTIDGCGIQLCCDDNNCHRARRIWDPDINPGAGINPGAEKSLAPTALPFDLMVLYSWRATRMPLATMVQINQSTMAIVFHCTVDRIDCPPAPLHFNVIVTMIPTTTSMDKASVERSFQYCHPVLSRPTVPNII